MAAEALGEPYRAGGAPGTARAAGAGRSRRAGLTTAAPAGARAARSAGRGASARLLRCTADSHAALARRPAAVVAPDRPAVSLPAVYRTLLDALDAVLEEGVPRAAIRGPDATAVTTEWVHAFRQAEEVVAAFSEGAATRGAVVRLVVAAAALRALARASGLEGAAAGAAPEVPELAALGAALDAAYGWARRSPGDAWST